MRLAVTAPRNSESDERVSVRCRHVDARTSADETVMIENDAG
jgi:hypothetical protein